MVMSTANSVLHDTNGSGIIPVVVRFVPYDQWCTTHIALSWTISQVKTWILAKCFHDSDILRILSVSLNTAAKAKDRNQPKRSVSPITFASVRMNKQQYAESLDDIHLQGFDEPDDLDGDYLSMGDSDSNSNRIYPDRHPRPSNPYIAHSRGAEKRLSSPPKGRPSLSSQKSFSNAYHEDYTLFSFSTLHILEDRHPVSWYNINPYELLELHPSGTIIRLYRSLSANMIAGSISTNARMRSNGNDKPGISSKDGFLSFEHVLGLYDYVKPYFQAPVKAFRVIRRDSHRSSRGTKVSSAREEELPLLASVPSSHLKAGRLLKHTRPNIHEVNFGSSASGETLPVEQHASLPDSISNRKDIGATNDQNSYSKVSATQSAGAKRRVIGSPDGARNKLDWQDRWLVIREGILTLCDNKEDIRNPSHSSHLSTLTALRGVEHLTTHPSLIGIMTGSSRRNHVCMNKRIICAKFLMQQDMERKEPSTSLTEREPEESDGQAKRTPHTTSVDMAHPNSPPYGGARNKDKTVWLIIDMLNEAAFDNIVRVLHRTAPYNVASSFLGDRHPGSSPSPFSSTTNDSQTSIHNRPSISSLRQSSRTASSGSEHLESIRSTSSFNPLPSVATPEPPHLGLSIDTSSNVLRSPLRHHDASKRSYERCRTVQNMTYLDWRMNNVMMAWRAGLGDVGKGMQVLLCGNTDEQMDNVREANSTTSKGLKTPKAVRSPTTARAISMPEDGSMFDDGDSESESWDGSLSPHGSAERELSENEWEGWQQDVTRQWTSIVEQEEFEYSSIHQVRFSDHDNSDDEGSSTRRRVYSDVHLSLHQPSLVMADLSVAMSEREEQSLFSPIVRLPGSVTSSTVSVGRPSERKRSSTVTAPQKRETKEKKQATKPKEKEKEPPPGRSRPPSLQVQPPISRQQEELETSQRRRTIKRDQRSRPTSILRIHSTEDSGLPTSPKLDKAATSEPSIPTNNVISSGHNGPLGDNIVRRKSKKAATLNGIVKGVSTAVKSKTKGML